MDRRPLDLERDLVRVLAMQKRSWEINFPGQVFFEDAFVRSLRGGARRGQLYAYEIDDQMVGWLWLDLCVPRVRGHIRHLQVKEPYWGHGIGKAIVEDAIAACVERRCPELTLNVTKSNRRAMTLYASLGFALDEDDGDRQRMCLSLVGDKAPDRQ